MRLTRRAGKAGDWQRRCWADKLVCHAGLLRCSNPLLSFATQFLCSVTLYRAAGLALYTGYKEPWCARPLSLTDPIPFSR